MIVVRPAAREDAPAIAGLLEELDRFYGVTEFESLDGRVHSVLDGLFGNPSAASALLAWDDRDLVGLMSYSFLWPAAGVTRSLYLKELYVRQDRRRQGIGRLLIDELYQVAEARRCSRVEWTTEIDNEGARRFYEALGAARLDGKVFYRVTR